MLIRIGALAHKIANQRAIPLAESIVPLIAGNGTILDYGSGPGHLAYQIAGMTGRDIVCLDIHKLPFTHPEIEITVYDGNEIPFPANHFDTTIAVFTLHHTYRAEEALREIIRVTRRHIIVVEDYLESRRKLFSEVVKDLLSNYFASRITFQYHTEMEWEQLFDRLGFEIREKILFDSSGMVLEFHHIGWHLTIRANSYESQR